MSHEQAAAWDEHAVTYATLFAPLTGFIARAMLQIAERRLPPRAALLDIACGTGALAIPAVRRAARERATTGGAGLDTATDFSPGMVALTQQAGAALGADADLLRCEVQDGQALTYKDGSFDAAFSSFGIFLFPDRLAGWREAARVLRSGGTFATAVWQGPQHNPMLRAQLTPILQALPPHLMPSSARSWIEIAEAHALRAEVTSAAPFIDARVYPFHASIVLPDQRATWEAMRDNPVMGALLRQCTPDELALVEETVLRSFREVAGGAEEPLILESACNILLATRA